MTTLPIHDTHTLKHKHAGVQNLSYCHNYSRLLFLSVNQVSDAHSPIYSQLVVLLVAMDDVVSFVKDDTIAGSCSLKTTTTTKTIILKYYPLRLLSYL